MTFLKIFILGDVTEISYDSLVSILLVKIKYIKQ